MSSEKKKQNVHFHDREYQPEDHHLRRTRPVAGGKEDDVQGPGEGEEDFEEEARGKFDAGLAAVVVVGLGIAVARGLAEDGEDAVEYGDAEG